jgi:Zn-dependent peptidase ImmA (M78 family)
LAENLSSHELPYERGARRALELRLRRGLGDAPLADLWALVREVGVNLGFHPFGEGGGDGLYRWNGETALIAANSSTRSRLRQRFTVAHELGHHELHRQGQSSLLIADKDIFGRQGQPIEEEANAFASHLLMPDPAIARTLQEWQVTQITADIVARLMQQFGVSFEVSVFRLHNAGRINAGERDRLFQAKRQVAVRALCDAISFNEFIDYPLPANLLPVSFESDVFRAYAARAISDVRLAELLRTADAEHALERFRAAGIELEDQDLSDDEFEALLGG